MKLEMNNVYLMDCMEGMADMPDDSVDIVVTSPPYNQLHHGKPTGMHKNDSWALRTVGGYNTYSDDMPEADYQKWMCEFLHECMRVSKGLVWINHKTRYRNGEGIHPLRFFDAPYYSSIVWDRGGSMALNCKKYAPSDEMIIGFGKPHYWNDELNTLMSVWRISPDNNKSHPCSFPIEIPKRLITSSCPNDGIVLDPFMGSGTTAIAAIDCGCNYMGFEIDADYYKAMQDRIYHFTRQEVLL